MSPIIQDYQGYQGYQDYQGYHKFEYYYYYYMKQYNIIIEDMTCPTKVIDNQDDNNTGLLHRVG